MKKRILFVLMITAGILQFACKKSNGGGMPVITSVRTVDTATRDSLFTRAIPGTLIVIQGSNLGGLQSISFNDTPAYFNPVYATSTHIIVNVPATAQTAASNPNVKNQIMLVTDHGTATYNFSLYLYPPTISSIAFDNTGTLVYINGNNFQGIQKITFPITGGGSDTALSYMVNKAFTQITAAIPPGAVTQDSLRVYATFGTSSYSYPPPMTITNISNENGAAGTTLLITGTNFVGISQVLFPGGIPGTNLQSLSVSQVSVTVPAGITAPDTLRLVGSLGMAASSQPFDTYITHPSPGYLSDFEVQYASDNTGFVGWTGGYADAPTAATTYPGATGATSFLFQGSPMPGNTNPGSQGNAGFVQLNDVPWVSNTSTPVSGYSLKFEVYSKGPWTAGAIWVMLGDWYGWHDYLARYAPWSNPPVGQVQPSGWVTATIPLTQFLSVTGGDNNEWDLKSFPTGGSPANTFADYASTALCFTIVNDQSAPNIAANTLNLAIDNVRIVKGQ